MVYFIIYSWRTAVFTEHSSSFASCLSASSIICYCCWLSFSLSLSLSLSLVNIQRTTWTNFVFISSNATLNIFLDIPFRIYTPLSSARHEAINISFLFSVQIKLSLMPTGLQTLWNSPGLHKMMFSKLAASYISPVSFVLFLLYVSRFRYLFAPLLFGGNLHSSLLQDTRSISKVER